MKINKLILNNIQNNYKKTNNNKTYQTNSIKNQGFDTVSFSSYEKEYELRSDKCIFEGLLNSPDLFKDKYVPLPKIGGYLVKQQPTELEQAFELAQKIDEEIDSDESRRALLDKFSEQGDEIIFQRYNIFYKLCSSIDEYNKNTDEASILFGKIIDSDDEKFEKYYFSAQKLAEKIDLYNKNNEAKRALFDRLIACKDDELIARPYYDIESFVRKVNVGCENNEVLENYYHRLVNSSDKTFYGNFSKIYNLAKKLDRINNNTDAKTYLLDYILQDEGRRMNGREDSVMNLAILTDKKNEDTSSIQKVKHKLETMEITGKNLALIKDCGDFIWLNQIFKLDNKNFEKCADASWYLAKDLDLSYRESNMMSAFAKKVTGMKDEEFIRYMGYIEEFSRQLPDDTPAYLYDIPTKHTPVHEMFIDRLTDIKNDAFFLRNAKFIQSYAQKADKFRIAHNPKSTEKFIKRLNDCNSEALMQFIRN